MTLEDAGKAILQYLVMPVAGFVWWIHRTQQTHATDIEVLKTTVELTKESHDRELKELRENFKLVLSKLDNIEQALRK